MVLLSLRGMKKNFGELCVLKNVSFDIKDGSRIGLVGVNGAGKTTLANIIFGNLKPDEGAVLHYKKEIKTGYLRQSTSYTVNTFNSMFNEGLATDIMEDFLEVTGHMGLNKVQEWEVEQFDRLSGGEKTKLALANVWVSKPDMLILDEPTNHMDFHGVQWLTEEIKKYQGSVLIISHDRYFLDMAVDSIIELEDGCVNEYQGNYTFYREEKARRHNIQLHQYIVHKKQQEKIEEEIKQWRNWSAKAHREAGKSGNRSVGKIMGLKEYERKKAKKMDIQIKSRIKHLERMKSEGVDRPKDEQKIAFEFDGVEKRGKRIIEAKNIEKAYGSRVLFKDSSFYIQRGERIGLLGINGCGKTTLLKVILGNEDINSGEFWVSPSLKIGYLSQDVLDLNEESCILDLLKETYGFQISKARTLLANMGFDEAMLIKPVKCLSLGERTRVKLANLILEENDILILDEPTNHLDLHSREQLEQTLDEYEGTILVVSHDRYLLDRICDKLLVFDGNKISKIDYSFNEYMDRIRGGKKDSKVVLENKTEEKMLIENRLVAVLGELSKYAPDDPKYVELDNEFKELVRRKRELNAT